METLALAKHPRFDHQLKDLKDDNDIGFSAYYLAVLCVNLIRSSHLRESYWEVGYFNRTV